MRVCIRKSDNYIIEGQGNDEALLGVLSQNAINAGYSQAEIETLIMPDDEFYTKLKLQNIG